MFNLNSKAMKTKTTFKNSLTTAVIALSLLFGFNVKAQTYVYDEVTSSGIFFDGNGAEVSNPVSDAVNSSENCANSGDAGSWQKIQYFPTYTPVAGDFLFISVYNPNGAGPGQIQFEYTSNPDTWQWGGNLEYTEDALTGWVEYSIDLTPHVGNQINKVIVMPAGGSEAEAYADNIYFGTVSVIPVPESPIVYNDEVASGIFFDGNGAEVSNPVSDAVNSSENCANSGDAGSWQKIQYFPTYTPVAGDFLFISVYNPNGAGPGQIQFEYTSNPDTWQWGGNLEYTEDALTGWVEYSIDLTPHVGNQINKVIVMPAGGSEAEAYADNIYFGTVSVIPVPESPIVYNDEVASGIFFDGNGAEVSNPVSDAVNSSENCANSGDAGNWQKIQYFPTYTPVAGDFLFISVYNPNGAGPGQIQFEYTGDPDTWQWGGNLEYTEDALTGWVEYSIDLTPHVGNQINKVIVMPAGGSEADTYADNIYFGSEPLSVDSVETFSEIVFFDESGRVIFAKDQTNTVLEVFDIYGRSIIKENVIGKKSTNTIENIGIYILRIKTGSNTFAVKKLMLR